jgi:hypothetical protein
MGRYLRGTEGFSYKYAFAEQEDNLVELAGALGAGTGGILPAFGGGYVDIEENFEVPVIPLLRAIQKDGKATGGEIGGVMPKDGELLPSPTLEFVQYAIGENIVEVVKRLDAALEGVPHGIELDGLAAFELAKRDYGKALAYVNKRLAAKDRLELTDLGNAKKTDAALARLGDTDNYLPAMALCIVRHAVQHKLSTIAVRETQASRSASDLWNLVTEWGPNIFGAAPPSSGEEWFVRAVVDLMRRDDAGKPEMATALKAGHEPAKRWVKTLKIDPKKVVKPAKPAKKKALPLDEQLEQAVAANDPDQVVDLLVQLKDELWSVKQMGATVGVAAGAANVEPLRAVWAELQGRDRGATAACNVELAIKYARIGARLDDKDAVICWLSAALALGADPKTLTADKAFAAYKTDAAFKKLASRKRVGKTTVDGDIGFYFGHTFVETKGKDHVFSRPITQPGAILYGLGNPNGFAIRLRRGREVIEMPRMSKRFEIDGIPMPVEYTLLVATADFPNIDKPLMLNFYVRAA